MRAGNEIGIRDDFDENQVRRAQREFESAESRIDSTLQAGRDRGSEDDNVGFVDAQRAIERSTKAVFELMDVNYPSEHAIDPRSQAARNLLHAISDTVDGMDHWDQKQGLLTNKQLKQLHAEEVARLTFLCYMFGNMYELASYGIDKEDIRLQANEFVQYTEYEYAVEYAFVALRIADVVIDSIATGRLPYVDPPTGSGPLEKRSSIKGRHYGVALSEQDFDPVAEYRREL